MVNGSVIQKGIVGMKIGENRSQICGRGNGTMPFAIFGKGGKGLDSSAEREV